MDISDYFPKGVGQPCGRKNLDVSSMYSKLAEQARFDEPF